MNTQKYDWDFLRELTFVSILILHILRHNEETEDYAKKYLKDVDRLHNFDRPMLNLPDLYMNIHGCIGKYRKSTMFSDSILNKRLNVNVLLLRKYIVDLHNGISISDSRRHLYRIEKEFKIKGIFASFRRMIQEWDLIDDNQKIYILKRLNIWLRNNARLIDYMQVFNLLLRVNNIHIPNKEDK